jgi:methionine synthase I (cobalamin-dependent)/5,10-methylenetetrahydrofolate reductase
MPNAFLERLNAGPLVCDGAMGTLLHARGIPFAHCFDELNLSNPDLVRQVHLDYIAAGADIIETNTFGANRIRLAGHGFEAAVRGINRQGAKLARDAREIAGADVLVAGAMGPTGKPLTPIGTLTPEEARAAFRQQAEALLEGGVDLFIVETMRTIEEVGEAVRAIRETCDLPIVAQMAFTEEGRTFGGMTAADVVRALEAMGVDVVGANCSIGPHDIEPVVAELLATATRPVSVQPNAGRPQLVGGRFVYVTDPAYFARYAREFVEAGVRMVGGCCGTTPTHIAAIAQAIGDLTGRERHPIVVVRERELEPEKEPEEEPPSEFARKLGKQFAISVELDPPRGTNPGKLIDGARLLHQHGVDAVNIADSPMARVRMSCIAVASLLQRQVGIETVLHYTCRDRNLMGMQSDLLGAHALGIRNVLAITGDPPMVGDYPNATAVYDVDSIGLVKILAALNSGADQAGNKIGRPTSFLIGVAVNPMAEDLDHEIGRLEAKVASGACFSFTQPLYDLRSLTEFRNRTEHITIPIFLGLLPLHSHRHTEFLHNEVPGIIIPERTRERMRLAGEEGRREGVRACRELLLEARESVAGAYIMPSFGRYETALEVIEGVR